MIAEAFREFQVDADTEEVARCIGSQEASDCGEAITGPALDSQSTKTPRDEDVFA